MGDTRLDSLKLQHSCQPLKARHYTGSDKSVCVSTPHTHSHMQGARPTAQSVDEGGPLEPSVSVFRNLILQNHCVINLLGAI